MGTSTSEWHRLDHHAVGEEAGDRTGLAEHQRDERDIVYVVEPPHLHTRKLSKDTHVNFHKFKSLKLKNESQCCVISLER